MNRIVSTPTRADNPYMAPSKGFASSYPRLAYVQRFCLQMLATPTSVMLREANELLSTLFGYASSCLVKALSPRLCPKSRKGNLVEGQFAMGTLMGLIDTILRVPPRILQERWPCDSDLCLTLTYTVNSLVDASLAHDRAAAELGLPLYDGGPLLGGAR